MGRRAALSDSLQESVLTKSARRCALCYGFDGSLDRKKGQLAHVDRDNANNVESNIVYLCLEHHDEYDGRPSQAKGITEREVRNYRDRLYEAVAAGLHHHREPGYPHERRVLDEKRIEHDCRMFRDGDEIIGEQAVADLLAQIGDQHAFWRSKWNRMYRFREHFLNAGHRFLVADVDSPLEELLVKIDALRDFLATHFWTDDWRSSGSDDDSWVVMEAGLNPDLSPAGYTPERERRYHLLAAELGVLLDAVADGYKEYRRSVKRNLFI